MTDQRYPNDPSRQGPQGGGQYPPQPGQPGQPGPGQGGYPPPGPPQQGQWQQGQPQPGQPQQGPGGQYPGGRPQGQQPQPVGAGAPAYGQGYAQGGGPGGPAGPGGPGGQWQGGGAFAGEPEPKKSSRTPLVIGLAVVLVLVAAAGAFAFSRFLGKSGDQPDTALPADAVAYVRLDLNPSGQEKINAYNFLSKFPAAKAQLGSQDEDFRKQFFNAIKKEESSLKNVSYETDIEPWIGDRIGMAAVPGGEGKKQPDAVAALEVKDQAKAEAGIKKLAGNSKVGVAFVGSYAVLAESQAKAQKFADSAKSKSLATNEQYSSDMQALGSDGILSFWVDGSKMASLLPSEATGGMGAMGAQGRAVGALRFESNFVEFAGLARGVPKVPSSEGTVKTGTLPDSTAAAISLANAGDLITKAWPQIETMAQGMGMSGELSSQKGQIESQLGIKIPGDIATLLGKELSVVLDSNGLEAGMSGGLPKAGVRMTTDVAKAEPILTKLMNAVTQAVSANSGGSGPQFFQSKGSDQLSVATTKDYADQLVKAGTLGQTEQFKAAIPSETTQVAMFVNLDKLEGLYLSSMKGDEKANLEPLSAVGLSVGQKGDDATFTARVVVN